ncbi:MAG: response regulator [Actinobacteria bacterium]|nr:response regulator [Actinomycetota bacterium]
MMASPSETGARARPANVLVVEDDAPMRRFLRAALANEGYRVTEAETAQLAMTNILARMPDLILLDLGLPDIDGADILRRVREWSQVPIVVLSARTREGDKVDALNSGADDYLTKPFGVPELLARVAVALRHAAALKDAGRREAFAFRTGDLEVDLANRRVTVKGHAVHLTRIEYRLLTVFVQNAGKVLTHEHLLREVWGLTGTGQAHYPRMYVASLRKKLEDDPADPRYLITEQGVGYRLTAD